MALKWNNLPFCVTIKTKGVFMMEKKKKRKSENKRFALVGLISAIIVNLVFRDPLKYSIVELKRFFEGGQNPQVLGYFFESFVTWIFITIAAFFIPFVLLKGISIEGEKSDETLKRRKERSKKIKGSFKETNRIGNYIGVDDNQKRWATYDEYGLIDAVHDYDDVVSFELLEDGNSVAEGGIGRALVGGALFGIAGAVVGGVTGRKTKEMCNSLKIKVTIKKTSYPTVYIPFITEPTRKDSIEFKSFSDTAQRCMSVFQLICENKKKVSNLMAPDEIKKYKELLDSGAITQEEYEKKKAELLEL